MKILVDADACPVKEIIVRLAKERSVPVTMLMERHLGAKIERRRQDKRPCQEDERG